MPQLKLGLLRLIFNAQDLNKHSRSAMFGAGPELGLLLCYSYVCQSEIPRNYNTMRLPFFSPEPLLRLLRAKKIATLPELQSALGSDVPLTVFRKLKELGYRTSYSHRGRFYTLDRIARFDEPGLWSHDSVWFSRYGTLVDTAEAFVNSSPSGYFVAELEQALHISVQDPLLHLVGQQRITRELVSGLYLYCSADAATRLRQLRARRAPPSAPSISDSVAAAESVSDELKAAIILFYSLLDEQQRRLYAGLEALKLGHGGDHQLAEFLGLNPHTIARGRQQLLEQGVEFDRVRKAGGGRKPLEKNATVSPYHRTAVGARYRRRSRYWSEVDSPYPREDRTGAQLTRLPHLCQHGGASAAPHELHAARQSQGDRLHLQSRPRPAVRVHLRTTNPLCASAT